MIKGLGLLTDKPLNVTRCPRSFGIKTRTLFSPARNNMSEIEQDPDGIRWAAGQVRWLVLKGDALEPGKERVETYVCHWTLKESDYPLAPKKKKRMSLRGNGNADLQPVMLLRDIVIVASEADTPTNRFADVELGKTLVVRPAQLLHAEMANAARQAGTK